ncbi:PREDICTED: protein fem-1 homolog C-like [Branchiostoma belcheri]|uniref:Protein fem-1 homolog C-like n=1 Tax=Branchiostoma belcheri TaxID=7741 RepID=A0A6P4XQZ8_BRABE|nr:PREDICTED: protein fem-1 homolog C-like [Branchiostoma belcheri]
MSLLRHKGRLRPIKILRQSQTTPHSIRHVLPQSLRLLREIRQIKRKFGSQINSCHVHRYSFMIPQRGVSPMENRAAVYDLAREGKLAALRTLLDQQSPEIRSALLNATTEGSTPLIAAARYGHLDVVNYLIEDCCADVEQGGSVTFDGETIEGAPPLWCSSAAGHLNIVKSLIQHGASVNNTTLTNSTPLRAACFDGHFEIVKYLVEHHADLEISNRHGHTCLMIACYKGHRDIVEYLLKLGADVNRKSIKGNTALHDCAESGSLEIMKLLLKYKAKMAKDSYGMTPLMAASVTGHTNIVHYLIARHECSRKERIDALELLGATFVDKKRDLPGALEYWRMSMDERFANRWDIVTKPPSKMVTAYDNVVEVQTFRELEELMADPDEMRMQALLIRERILGPSHPDTSYYIRYRGAVYADAGNFDRCIVLWTYALDMQQSNLEPLNPMTQSSLLSFAELFSYMLQEPPPNSYNTRKLTFLDTLTVFAKAVAEVEKGMLHYMATPLQEKDITHLNRAILIIMHLICLLTKVKCTVREDFLKRQAVYRFLHLKPRGAKGMTPLHFAVDEATTTVGRYPVCKFPSLEAVKILIECGACLNAVDVENNTALHIAAKNNQADIMKELLKAGLHFDACNLEGKTSFDLLPKKSLENSINPLNYTSLQCLAARAIKRFQIEYKGVIPAKLESFVAMH